MKSRVIHELPKLAALVVIAVAIVVGFDAATQTSHTASRDDRRLSHQQAIDASIEQAAHLIQDARVETAVAERLSYAEAEQRLPGANLVGKPTAEHQTWLVTLRGWFPGPSGPPPLIGAEPAPQSRPSCSVITVILDDQTGEFLRLSFAPAEDCLPQ